MVKPVTLKDGRILALSISTNGRQQKMCGRYSSDDGQTWSARRDLFELPESQGGFGYFVPFADRDGEVHIFYLNDGNTGTNTPKSLKYPPIRKGPVLDIWYVRSRSGVSTWDAPKRIWTGRAGDLLSVIQLKSGRILLPISYMTDRSWGKRGNGFKAYTYVGTFNTSAIYSDDGGVTWTQSPDQLVVPTPDLSTLGGVEPVVLQLKDGRVWMLIRTQLGRFYESFSSDEGVHWSIPKPSDILASESPAGLVRLADGRLLMIWNEAQRYPYAYGGRHVLHAALSTDEGRTWTNHREILRDPMRKDPPPPNGDWGVAYPFATVTKSGDVIFSLWVQTGKARYLYRLSPGWLEETYQKTNFDSGIDDWSIFGTRGVELTNLGKESERVLSIRRAASDWPSGAVWNFPMGKSGQLRLEVRLQPGFGGDILGLTDHFSVPFDDRDTFYNVFNLPISADGKVLSASLSANQWHEINLEWDAGLERCSVSVDGKVVGVIKALRRAEGIDYLRFHPTSDVPDGALLLRSAEANVSASGGVAPVATTNNASHSGDVENHSRGRK